ncbi:MAG: sensor histidine kinase [Acidimicrobiia bacterium]
MRRALALLGLVLAALAVTEIAMSPSSSDRLTLAGLFAALAAGAALAAWVLPRLLTRLRSLRHTVLVLALAAVATAVVATGISAGLMFISTHDLQLVIIVLGLASGLAAVVAVAVAESLASDLRRLGDTAARVATGDLGTGTGVNRPDEVGAAARTLDLMVVKLAAAESDRAAVEEQRRALLAAISHDLRTPLAALHAAVEALEDGVSPDPARYLEAMHRDLEALEGLVDDLFLLAKIDAGRLEVPHLEVDLAELADEAVEALAPVANRRGIAVRLRTQGRVTAIGGPTELGRAIRNLVDNAIRHAPPASEVWVEVVNGEGALLRVIDQGPGFPEDFRSRAFQRFARADLARGRSTGGAGLGLAIAKGVIEAHGGRIWIESGPGGRVVFALPPDG